jgi:hypothetical protein
MHKHQHSIIVSLCFFTKTVCIKHAWSYPFFCRNQSPPGCCCLCHSYLMLNQDLVVVGSWICLSRFGVSFSCSLCLMKLIPVLLLTCCVCSWLLLGFWITNMFLDDSKLLWIVVLQQKKTLILGSTPSSGRIH